MHYLNICLQGLNLSEFHFDCDHLASEKLGLVAIDHEIWSYTNMKNLMNKFLFCAFQHKEPLSQIYETNLAEYRNIQSWKLTCLRAIQFTEQREITIVHFPGKNCTLPHHREDFLKEPPFWTQSLVRPSKQLENISFTGSRTAVRYTFTWGYSVVSGKTRCH